jgi:16S rRNA (uracil1498-N3)-methyltransferase
MHEPWFHCPDLRSGIVCLSEVEARHAQQTLRLGPGAIITLFDGAGRLARARVVRPEDDKRDTSRRRRGAALRAAVCEITTTAQAAARLTLIVAACKGERQDWLVEKCTELGVARLLFTRFQHSVVLLGETQLQRLRRVALAACKQCRRPWVPSIEAVVSLTEALVVAGAVRLAVAHLQTGVPTFANWLGDTVGGEVTLVIGPEGGIEADELDLLRQGGGGLVTLGPHTLRVETAAVSAAAIHANLTQVYRQTGLVSDGEAGQA